MSGMARTSFSLKRGKLSLLLRSVLSNLDAEKLQVVSGPKLKVSARSRNGLNSKWLRFPAPSAHARMIVFTSR